MELALKVSLLRMQIPESRKLNLKAPRFPLIGCVIQTSFHRDILREKQPQVVISNDVLCQLKAKFPFSIQSSTLPSEGKFSGTH
jgi:hypothetical protein